ncbi:1-aminocyclopropane-1-carboxylate deaminase [Aquimarina sp. EL_43]|uniref:1-aminocyclopropane-1-carboxylate deaminase/D-cysteine desulfhydrase n=1 Tax=unclassified Aquimarina TaxID=2627091 RepID=UPI0018CB6754|nr:MULTISPECIES: pyridoxal-phosphate dependent enzyme [unclassified Aquimarina]MBG6130032.1 1-aminocyclopropane-1-carboxylate deaminase [Aquimarina sp. EL_35]MBG6148812.1 1-aminocyclopropane-1-carboxylate deaminase [Aquimarina sp. EL_32]MBG6168814.1 1-aminocyclopropane-1-carboxylate deaminase [Aquimarina sp. EL_43]
MHIFFSETQPSKNQSITHSILDNAGVVLDIKREDQIHRDVSGNKFRKLKYNLIEAKKSGYATILTFGGAYSNHIAATAAAGEIMGLQTIGIIRGDELAKDLEKTLSENDTLRFAHASGMHFKFISREQYREKTSSAFLEQLKDEFGSCYIIPEGGTNDLAVKGCEEILTPQDNVYDIICCAVGTGGTISGVINSAKAHQTVMGFPALKGDFLDKEIKKHTSKTNWKLISEYHFGGYGKINQEGVEFMNMFNNQQHIALDPVYTVKMVFGIFDLVQKGVFKKNTRILAIHTGGLQGIAGMNKKLKKKKLPLITIEY